MTAYIFNQIASRGRAENIRTGTIEARDWYRDQASSIGRVNTTQLMKSGRLKSKLSLNDVGRMFMFFYDPKYKKTLPYYDRFPLIFMIDRTEAGFYGLNLHYLPLIYRARLMDALYTIEMDVNETKKLKLTYNLLKSAAKFKYFRPCIKQYLNKHMQSRFLEIPYDQWDIALMLPTERFEKQSKQSVWSESKQIISGS